MQKTKNKTKPFYLEMAENLEEKIRSGFYQPGKKLPSIEELTEKYNVHKNTVKSAFKTLREKGLVRNYSGVGIVVKEDLRFPLKIALMLPAGYGGLEDIVNGVDESLKDCDASLEIMFFRTPAEQSEYLKRLKEKDFSGAIIRADFSGDGYGSICRIQDEKFPIVLIENFYQDSNGLHADSGTFDAAFKAVTQLNETGCFPIGAVCPSDKFGEAFIEGYKEAHIKLKLICSRNNIKYITSSSFAGDLSVELVKMKTPPRAIIYANPSDAVAGYKALKECGADLRCMKLLSFGEVPNSELFTHPILFIKRDFKELGHKAAKLIIEKVKLKQEKKS